MRWVVEWGGFRWWVIELVVKWMRWWVVEWGRLRWDAFWVVEWVGCGEL